MPVFKAAGIIFFMIFGILFFSACREEDPTEDKQVLARVFDKYFFAEDLSGFPEDLSKEDSMALVKSKTDLWITKQLMLSKAELNLTEEQKNIKRIVEDYRASLLIDKYKREFLKEKLDTNVSDYDVTDYYNKYSESFKTSRVLVKAVYVKIPIEAEGISEFRYMFSKNAAEDTAEIQKFIKDNALIHRDFRSHWIPYSELSILLPTQITNIEPILKSSAFIFTQDIGAYYFIRFDDYKLKGEVKPLELVKDEIKLVLINKRKIELINSLERNIYQNAVEYGNLEIFDGSDTEKK